MFRKILIANRGEIALRILRACRALDIRTVAVYSEADRDSLHVRFSDEDICIGPAPSAESYLNIPRILSAAEITGADAIHPGYGFLAENPEFAEICERSGVVFIGPTAEQIRRMGDKAEARRTMIDAGVPVVPGSVGLVEDLDAGLEEARAIGFPVMIKASAGGGGKGMRPAFDEDEFIKNFPIARNEAEVNFSNGALYLEKLIQNPRHVEIQLLGDRHGNIVHLGERDCSVQRRHQKLIEEAPSPAVTPELREAMGEAAIRGAVEHPVTEMVTNTGLIKAQIRVAAGEKLEWSEPPPMMGHAIECRINAEDPEHGFRPSPGRITTFHAPGGPGVRVDTHVYAGYVVPPYYDSLLAKLIVHGKTRDEARMRAYHALEEFILEGVHTTIPFLRKVLVHPDFAAGEFDTSFVERYMTDA